METLSPRLLLAATPLSGYAGYNFLLDPQNSNTGTIAIGTNGVFTNVTSDGSIQELSTSGAVENTIQLDASGTYTLSNAVGGSGSIGISGALSTVSITPNQITGGTLQIDFDSTFTNVNPSTEFSPNGIAINDSDNNDTIVDNGSDLTWAGPQVNLANSTVATISVSGADDVVRLTSDADAGLTIGLGSTGDVDDTTVNGDASTVYQIDDIGLVTDAYGDAYENPLTINAGGGVIQFSAQGGNGGMDPLALGDVSVTGFGAAGQYGGDDITFSGQSAVTFTLAASSLTFAVTGVSSPTTIVGDGDTIDVGKNLAALGGSLTIVGNGNDALNLYDTTDPSDASFTVSGSAVTGLGNISYRGIESLELWMNDLPNSVAVTQTSTSTSVVETTGACFITLSGPLSNYAAPVSLFGDAGGTLNISDGGDQTPHLYTISDTHVGGGGMTTGGISYYSFSAVNFIAGDGDNTIDVNNTSGNATTTIFTGAGATTVNLRGVGGTTIVDHSTGSGVDTFSVAGDASGVSPEFGTLSDCIVGALTIEGSAIQNDRLCIDDSDDTIGTTGTLTYATIVGFGLSNPINFSGIGSLKVWLGAGANQLYDNGPNAGVVNIHAGVGHSFVWLSATNGGTTTINVGTAGRQGSGIYLMANLHPQSPSWISGVLNLVGSPLTTLRVADTSGGQSGAPIQSTINSNFLSGFGLYTSAVYYTNIGRVVADFGAPDNQVLITGANPMTSYTFNGALSGGNSAMIDYAGPLDTSFGFSQFGSISVGVDDFTGSLFTTGAIAALAIDGDFAAGATVIAQGGIAMGAMEITGADLGTIQT